MRYLSQTVIELTLGTPLFARGGAWPPADFITNAPCPGFVTIQCEGGIFDAFSFSSTLEKHIPHKLDEMKAIKNIIYTGYCPPGFVEGSKYTFCMSVIEE